MKWLFSDWLDVAVFVVLVITATRIDQKDVLLFGSLSGVVYALFRFMRIVNRLRKENAISGGFDKKSECQKIGMRKFASESFGKMYYSECQVFYLNTREELRQTSLDLYQKMVENTPIEDMPECILIQAEGTSWWGTGYFLKFRDGRNFWELRDPGELHYVSIKRDFVGLKDLVGNTLTLDLGKADKPDKFARTLKFVTEYKSVRDFEAKKIADWAAPKLLDTKKSMGSSQSIELIRVALERSSKQGIFNGKIIYPGDEKMLEIECYLLPA